MVAGTLQILHLQPSIAGNGFHFSRTTTSQPPFLKFRRNVSGLSGPPKFRPLPVRAAAEPNQGSGPEENKAKSLTPANNLDWIRPLSKFAGANFLPLALVSGIILGLVNPSLGCIAHKYSLSKYSTFGIFVISGLVLKSEEIGAATEAWPAGTFGLISILLLTPFFSRFLLQFQLTPREFVNGLAIFCCMPTTLSSGVTLTQLVGGNSALALAMTVVSNLLGILFVPFSLSNLVGQQAGVSIPTDQLFRSLTFTLLIPLIFGKVLRDSFGGVSQYVDGHRRHFSMLSAILLSLVPWMQVSRSRSLLLAINVNSFLKAIFLGMFLHLILLAMNTLALQSLSVVSGGQKSIFAEKKNARAVVIVASQKTLPVMVAVVEQLGGALGESGLLVLPCVAAHIVQIIIDSFLVNFWLQKDQKSSTAQSL